MQIPEYVAISQQDIIEFERMLDAMPHAQAKHLATWLNWKILAQIDRNAEAEKQWVEALAELDKHRLAVAAGEKRSFFDDLFPKPSAPESDADPTILH